MKSFYSLRDAKAEAFLPPFVADNRATAIRSLADAVNKPSDGSPLASHPEDFALFELGSFDELTGVIVPAVQPVSVITALELTSAPAPLRVAQ